MMLCVVVYETGCGDAAKTARLQFRALQKLVNQTAYNSITLLL